MPSAYPPQEPTRNPGGRRPGPVPYGPSRDPMAGERRGPGASDQWRWAPDQSTSGMPGMPGAPPGPYSPDSANPVPRYVPGGGSPPRARPDDRAGRPPRPRGGYTEPKGRSPVRVPTTRAARTDPTLYEWDRLTPEQQQAVLDTIKGAKGSGSWSLRRPLMLGVVLIVLLAALVTVFLLSHGHF